MEVKYWQHPAEASISSTYEKEDKGSIHIYTDGSKTDEGDGSGIAIFESGQYIKSLQSRLKKKFTKKQAEKKAIKKALQDRETKQRTDKKKSQYKQTVK
jgi:ribonuclease HI